MIPATPGLHALTAWCIIGTLFYIWMVSLAFLVVTVFEKIIRSYLWTRRTGFKPTNPKKEPHA